MPSAPASAPAREVLSQHHNREQADEADGDDGALNDTTGDIAQGERLTLPPYDGPQHDRGADVGDNQEDLEVRAQPDARLGAVTEDVVGVVEHRVVEEQCCNRGDEREDEQHAHDSRALLLLRRRDWLTSS